MANIRVFLLILLAFLYTYSVGQTSRPSRPGIPSANRRPPAPPAPEVPPPAPPQDQSNKAGLKSWSPIVIEAKQGLVSVELQGNFPSGSRFLVPHDGVVKEESESIKQQNQQRPTAVFDVNTDSLKPFDTFAIRVLSKDGDDLGQATFFADNKSCSEAADIEATDAAASAEIGDGKISGIKIDTPGAGYVFPPAVVIQPPTSGQKARAHATLDQDGSISEIVLDDHGAGYTKAPEVHIYRGMAFPSVNQCSLPTPQNAHHVLYINATSKTAKLDDGSVCEPPSTRAFLDKKDLYERSDADVTFVVCNKNPFRYSYSLAHDSSQIENDDLSSVLGLLTPGGQATQAARTAASATASMTNSLDSIIALREEVPDAVIPEVQRATNSYGACVSHVMRDMQDIERDYSRFVLTYQPILTEMRDNPELTCSERLSKAINLFGRVTGLAWNEKISRLAEEITQYQQIGNIRTQWIESLKTSNTQADLEAGYYTAVQSGLSADNCIVKQASQNIGTNIQNQVLEPLRAILGDRDAFVFTSQPFIFTNPTQLHWSLTVQSLASVSQLSASAVSSGSDYLGCFSFPSPAPAQGGGNPGQVKGKGTDTGADNISPTVGTTFLKPTRAKLIFVSSSAKPTKNPADQNGSPSRPGTNSDTVPPPTGDAAPNTPKSYEISSGDIMLGAPRVLGSIGLAVALLRDQQFQAVKSGTGASVIEYKTNSLTRFSPLAFAHVRLGRDVFAKRAFDIKRDWWGTFGITAKSSTEGTSPEYMFGVSHGFWDDWFFVTAGGYVGQKQTLAAGNSLGGTLPSSASGSVPVQQNYKVGFALALSFRIPGTSVPKASKSGAADNSSATPAKQQKGGSKNSAQ